MPNVVELPARAVSLFRTGRLPALSVLAIAVLAALSACTNARDEEPPAPPADDGQSVFRHETFGNEQFWTDTARLHEVITASVSPMVALAAGLKVDVNAISPELALAIRNGSVDMNSPATTVALLKLGAVVGLTATVSTVNGRDSLVRVGITCALCHSTVDHAPGIGERRDGWPNRDLNVGAIIAMSPAITPAQRLVYNSWGPGRYDPRYNLDGLNTPLVIPPAYGLSRVTNETYTAEGPIGYWNAYVAITQMHGQGDFSDERLGISVSQSPDLVAPRLAALRAYQHGLQAPPAPAGSYDSAAAVRGAEVFERACSSCHVGVSGTDNNEGILHTPAETGMDPAYAARTATRAYRTTPLRGLWQHPPYFHDGSAPTLAAVVAHYNRVMRLSLPAQQQQDLIEFLKTL